MLNSASPICAGIGSGPTGCSAFSRRFMYRYAIQVAMELDADAVKRVSGASSLGVATGQSLNMVFLALNVDPTTLALEK